MSDSENIDGKEALDYFKNLTSDPSDHIMSLQDMEKTIKFHEEELAAEDKRVEGTDEYPNYGDDFADMVYIARRLLDEIERLREALRIEQEEVAACCIDRKATQRERDEVRRMYCEKMSMQSRQQDCTPQWFAEEMGWDCFKE
jgi:hypothetical protein